MVSNLIKYFKQHFPFFPKELEEAMEEEGVVQILPAQTMILRAEDYVKVVPFVLQGAIKVYVSHEEKELLLYYIQKNESCIMSFSAAMNNTVSQVYAFTEEDTSVVLFAADKVAQWAQKYPIFDQVFFTLYGKRYTDLVRTITGLLFEKLDDRLWKYLQEKSKIRNTKQLDLRHREIATELGSAREVISRVLKKLEREGKVKIHTKTIEIVVGSD